MGPEPDDVLIAAATLGTGRIVSITQDGYLVDFAAVNSNANVARLHTNIKNWVSKGAYTGNAQMMTTDDWLNYTGTNTILFLYTV